MRTAYLCLVLLAGCATPEQRQAQTAAYVERLEAACTEMGYARNSEAGVQCGLRLHNQLQMGAALQAAARPAPAPYQSFRQPPRPTYNTSCNREGGTVYCTTQ